MKERRVKAIEIITLHYFMTHEVYNVEKIKVNRGSDLFAFTRELDVKETIEKIADEVYLAAKRAEDAATSARIALSEVGCNL